MSTFEVFETAKGGRIKAWVKGVPVEDSAGNSSETWRDCRLCTLTSPSCPTSTSDAARPLVR